MIEIFETIDGCIAHIKKTHWDGKDYLEGFKNSKSTWTSCDGIREQFEKSQSTKDMFSIFAMVNKPNTENGLEVLLFTVKRS